MIFISVGSRKFQFDRLIKEIDYLVNKEVITDEVFAQIGASKYVPKNFEYTRFLSAEEYKRYQKDAKLLITHGGTGAMLSALKLGKNVIAVPRLYEFHEHSDDHQLQVSGVLEEEGYLQRVIDIKNLEEAIKIALEKDTIRKYNRESKIIDIIDEFIIFNNSK